MYERKIALIKEYDKLYTAKSKTLGGVAVVLCDGVKTKVTIKIVNSDRMRLGSPDVLIECDGKVFSYPIIAEKTIPCSSIKRVSIIILFAKRAVAYADTFDNSINLLLLNNYTESRVMDKTMQYKEQNEQESDVKKYHNDSVTKTTEYEKFLINTENYYITEEEEQTETEKPKFTPNLFEHIFKQPMEESKKENDETHRALENDARTAVKKYAAAFNENAGKNGFYFAVKDEIKALFDSFPICEELTEKIQNSVWAKVLGKDDKYFALGIMLYNNLPRYICYALPVRQGMFSGKSVFLNVGKGYRVVSQDAGTGLIAEGVDFGII